MSDSPEPSDEPNAVELEFIANDVNVGAYEAAMATFGPNEPDAAFKVMGEIRFWRNRAIWRAGYAAGVATHPAIADNEPSDEQFAEDNADWHREISEGEHLRLTHAELLISEIETAVDEGTFGQRDWWRRRAIGLAKELKAMQVELDALHHGSEPSPLEWIDMALSANEDGGYSWSNAEVVEMLTEIRRKLSTPALAEPTTLVLDPASNPTPYPICCCATCGPPWRGQHPRPDQNTDPVGFLSWGSWMTLCPRCGSKRCPGAADHRNACTSKETSA